MPDLAIDRAIALQRRHLDYLERLDRLHGGYLSAVHDCRAALAILEAARAWKAAWGTPAIHAAEQDLGRAIRGESC